MVFCQFELKNECIFYRYEAEKQLMRDKVVETQLINLLRERSEDCMYYETYLPKEVHDPTTKCGELKVIKPECMYVHTVLCILCI